MDIVQPLPPGIGIQTNPLCKKQKIVSVHVQVGSSGFAHSSIMATAHAPIRHLLLGMRKDIWGPSFLVVCVACTKKEGGGGREKSTKVGKREGSACYKSQCFCIPPTIFWTNPIMSLSIRDQSQVRVFSAWPKLYYFVCQKLLRRFFKWYHNRAK